MPERVHITSVEALEAFRASLIIYLSKARPTLDEVGAEVLRTRLWLQNTQRIHLEGQVRRRTKEFEQAQQAFFSARHSTLREETVAERMAVQKAKRALEEAEAKLKLLKQWNREFDSRVEPLARQLEKLQTVLANDMSQAVVSLAKTVTTLHAYAEAAPPPASADLAAPSGQKAEADLLGEPGPAGSVSPATGGKDFSGGGSS
jgi:hypothetical protein